MGGHVAGFNCGHIYLHKTESEPPMHRFTVIIYEYFSTVEGIYWRTLFWCRLISLQSPFPLPSQLSKHLPNLSLSLFSLCRDLPMQADRKGRARSRKRRQEKNVNYLPMYSFTYSICQWRTQFCTKTHCCAQICITWEHVLVRTYISHTYKTFIHTSIRVFENYPGLLANVSYK